MSNIGSVICEENKEIQVVDECLEFFFNEMAIDDIIGCVLIMGTLYVNFATSVVKVAKKLSVRKRKIAKPRKYWVNPLNTVQKRRAKGDHHNLIREMREYDESRFTEHLRMSPKCYDKLLKLVSPLITKCTAFRKPIDPGTRLEVTLRYLATGESCISLANQFRLGRSTVPTIIDETLPAIYQVLKDKVLLSPTREDLLNTAEGFWERWNFPNCLGAVDGKHIAIIAPPDSGSEYYNYKHFHSIIFLAVCDYRYRFTMIDVGTPGRRSDGGVFRESNIGKQFEESWIDLPEPTQIGADGPILPYYLVGDAGFGLKKYLQRPYPGRNSGNLPEGQRIYNYRLSRARRVIENSFGILAAKWRIFRQPIQAGVEKVENATLAAICLHNFILMEESELKAHQRTYLHPTIMDRVENGVLVEGDWRKDSEPIHHETFVDILHEDSEDEMQDCENDEIQDCEEDEMQDCESEERVIVTSPVEIRNELKEFFMTSGNVKWQFTQNLF